MWASLSSRSQDEVVLDLERALGPVTRVLLRRTKQTEKRPCGGWSHEGPSQGASGWQAATGSPEEVWKGFSSLMEPTLPTPQFWAFGLQDCGRINRFKPPVCGALLQQPRSSCTWVAGISHLPGLGFPQLHWSLSSSACSLPLSLHPSLHPKAKTESSQGPLLVSHLPPKEVKSHSELPEDDGWGEWGRVWEKAWTSTWT